MNNIETMKNYKSKDLAVRASRVPNEKVLPETYCHDTYFLSPGM